MADREHRAEARSMRALWEARRVLVVGPGVPEGLDARRARAVLAAQLAAPGTGPEVTVLGVAGELGEDVRLRTRQRSRRPWIAVVTLPARGALCGSGSRVFARTLVVLGGLRGGPEGSSATERCVPRIGRDAIGPSPSASHPGEEAPLSLTLAARSPCPVGRAVLPVTAVAARLLDDATARGIGVSQFLSAGTGPTSRQ